MPIESSHRGIVVCIPTYRRPDLLAGLLRALAMQQGAPAFDILVGDNEAEAVPRSGRAPDPSLTFSTIAVTIRGVSAVRNAMIADVLSRGPAVRWIACIDDDQTPAADWLARLVATGEAYDADLVGGPVERTVPATTFWSSAAADTSYLPRATGPTPMLNEAGNLLLSTRFLRRLDRPPFSVDYGRTGGEDYEFFLYARSMGARIVWANDAFVTEPLRIDRVMLEGYALRFYTIAAYQARADYAYRGLAFVFGQIGRDCMSGMAAISLAIVRDRRPSDAIRHSIRCAMTIAGRFAGLIGHRRAKYGSDA